MAAPWPSWLSGEWNVAYRVSAPYMDGGWNCTCRFEDWNASIVRGMHTDKHT